MGLMNPRAAVVTGLARVLGAGRWALERQTQGVPDGEADGGLQHALQTAPAEGVRAGQHPRVTPNTSDPPPGHPSPD